MKKRVIQFFLMSCLSAYASLGSAMSISEQRETFFKAEQLLKKNQQSDFLNSLDSLKDYPLHPLLESQWLRKNLDQTAEIESFLSRYENERSGNLLRRAWLKHLAKTQQWSRFLANYQDSSKVSLQCYYHLAQYKTGKTEVALKAAKTLWVKPKSQPPECNPLFSQLQKSAYFNNDLIWQRFQSALQKGKKGNVSLAVYLKKLLSKSDQKNAALWLQVHNKPALITHIGKLNTNSEKVGDIFAHGVYRLARKNLSLAVQTWKTQKERFNLSVDNIDLVEKKLGLNLGYRGQTKASYQHLSQITHPDEEARQWRVRSALRNQNWQHVNTALATLSSEEKQQEKWRYWQARAWEELGKKVKATSFFNELAKERSYYGFAAADKIKKAYQLNDKPIQASSKDLQKLSAEPAFKIVDELRNIGRKKEAKWHWWFAVKKLDAEQIKLAAKLAEKWGDTQTAVFTVAKAKYWDDVNLRFPLAFKDEVNQYAAQQNLDPAVVFGLIRQESVFDPRAGSRVGARGLMQIMPATGKQIARELKEKWHSANNLYQPETNIRYGTYYYKKLLNRFDGQFALAAAGYNAGPHRVKRWRPETSMPMDIWIETIPFNETRKYVSVVLMNTIIYQQRLNRNSLKMTDFLSKVQPS